MRWYKNDNELVRKIQLFNTGSYVKGQTTTLCALLKFEVMMSNFVSHSFVWPVCIEHRL